MSTTTTPTTDRDTLSEDEKAGLSAWAIGTISLLSGLLIVAGLGGLLIGIGISVLLLGCTFLVAIQFKGKS